MKRIKTSHLRRCKDPRNWEGTNRRKKGWDTTMNDCNKNLKITHGD